jgi:purine nucleosidase
MQMPNVKKVLIPLKVSHTCLIDASVREKVANPHSDFGKLIVGFFDFFQSTYLEVFDMPHPPLHDPLAVAYVISPELFQLDFLNLEIECNSQLTLGQTVADFLGVSKRPKNVHLAAAVNVPAFWTLMTDAINTANKNSQF